MVTALQRNNKGLANLRPFQPGQSGNPLGRSIRKYSVVNEIKNELAGVYTDKYTAQVIARRLLGIIISKKTSPGIVVQACALVFQYTETKPVERIEIVKDDKRVQYLACLQFVKDKLAQSGADVPPDAVLIDGIATTRGYEDIRECLSDLYNAGAVEG